LMLFYRQFSYLCVGRHGPHFLEMLVHGRYLVVVVEQTVCRGLDVTHALVYDSLPS